jgi:hypothetical protein
MDERMIEILKIKIVNSIFLEPSNSPKLNCPMHSRIIDN